MGGPGLAADLAARGLSVEQLLQGTLGRVWQKFLPDMITKNCESAPCEQMMANLQAYVDIQDNMGGSTASGRHVHTVSLTDNIAYTDPSTAARPASRDQDRSATAPGRLQAQELVTAAPLYRRCGRLLRGPGQGLPGPLGDAGPVVELGLEISQLRGSSGGRRPPRVIT